VRLKSSDAGHEIGLGGVTVSDSLACVLASFNHAFLLQAIPSFCPLSLYKEGQRQRQRSKISKAKHMITLLKIKACEAGSNSQQFYAYASQRHFHFNGLLLMPNASPSCPALLLVLRSPLSLTNPPT
jgi:hypothetical protein